MFAQINQWIKSQLPEEVINQWQQLSTQERKLLKLLGWVLSVALLYFLFWQPVQSALNDAERKLSSAKAQWHWLNDQAPKLAQTTVGRSSFDTQSKLIAFLQQAMRRENILKDMTNIIPINQRSYLGISVSFDSVSAPGLFYWLSSIEQQGVSPYQMEVTPIQTGLVKAKIDFKVGL
ncbi:MAG: type II secretion system protein M [Hydrogenovibrio sp.]|nr:type II secretion system protein M [Hydrogenovibrio sp.]